MEEEEAAVVVDSTTMIEAETIIEAEEEMVGEVVVVAEADFPKVEVEEEEEMAPKNYQVTK